MARLLAGGELPRAIILDLDGMETEAQTLTDLWQICGQVPLLLCGSMASRGLLGQPGMPPGAALLRPFRVAEVVTWVREMIQNG
jgi:hypothetical protein